MGQILIRNLDEAVLAKLRQHADAAGISVEEEARRALVASTGLIDQAALVRLDELRTRIGRISGPSSLDDLRRDRARDELA